MLERHGQTARISLAAAIGAGLLAAACSSGGGGSESFSIQSISVPDGSTWAINRPIEFVFSEPVDFSSVNLNTITIRQPNGLPAFGTFILTAPDTVVFQPACPTLDDFSDAGFAPSPSVDERIQYTVNVVPPNGPRVRSLSGNLLDAGQPRTFTTPLIDEPLDSLFLDTAIGPPLPIVRDEASTETVATRIQIGPLEANSVFFERTPSGIVLEGGDLVPLNLYSEVDTQIAVVIEFNQAVNPLSSNINPQRLRLEFEETPGGADWTPIGSRVVLERNCSETGATVRLTPLGILPQDRALRVVIAPEFQDLVGETSPNQIDDFAPMQTLVPDHVGLPDPEQEGDEVFEEFILGSSDPLSLEDAGAAFVDPRADWGDDRLAAGFAFDGTGGPGGNFDLHIQIGAAVIFDTTSTVFVGGPGGLPTTQEVAVNGRLDVRNLVIPDGATLLVQGPHPAKIVATGTVTVDGKLLAIGSSNKGVVTLLTANIPEPGASGQAGGGKGGQGSPLTSQSDPRGQRGFGAFDQPGGGGEGGESGYNTSGSDNDGQRRPGGGGGGALGKNVVDPTSTANCNRFDNNIIGLDAEAGFDGAFLATGALHPGVLPKGGAVGPRPFFDGNPNNDFWGILVTPLGTVIEGELLRPWAGAGGGGGGDTVKGSAFPADPFTPGSSEKGAGGGGGGGSLHIQALGDVSVGPRGRIDVRGGVGGGGENTNGINRIGGGSGGGSGGHLIIETASQIDLTRVIGTFPATSEQPNAAFDVGLVAPGGQGGAGGGELGGATFGGNQTPPCDDAFPPGSCGITGASPNGPTVCAGGDGGPGIIQLHVPNLAGPLGPGDILPPVSGRLFNIGVPPAPPMGNQCNTVNGCIIKNDGVIKPPPVGVPPTVKSANDTIGWSQLIPTFGQFSRAQSKWVPLGEAGAQSGTPVFEALDFFFDGTDAGGLVSTASQHVVELPPVLGTAIGSGSVLAVENNFRTAVISGNGLVDDVYQRNPELTRRFLLRLFPSGGGPGVDFEVVVASFDSLTGLFRFTVGGTGPVLQGFAGADFELRPRFFRVSTDGDLDSLPDSATVQIEFQATTETLTGVPDETVGVPSAWVADIDLLDGNPDWRFVRFRVRFDIQATGSNLDASTPRPALEFLKIPFRF